MQFVGMNAETGERIEGIEHFYQCCERTLSTPIGTHILKRDFGLDFDIVDKNTTNSFRMNVIAKATDALEKWEPRISVSRVFISSVAHDAGDVRVGYEATYLPDGRQIKREGVIL